MHRIILVTLFVAGSLAEEATRLKSLEILTVLNGRACNTAVQVAIDAVNESPDILPDFRISASFQDEGPLATSAPRRVVEFMENTNRAGNRTLIAPAIIGTWFACSTSSRTVRAYNLVQFSPGCNSMLFTANRKDYPNLYRYRNSLDLFSLAFQYAIQAIGKWKQLAIMANMANVATSATAQQLQKMSAANGIDVVWYNSVSDIDTAVIDSLKASRARVIAVTFSDALVYKFLCVTHLNGIKAPQYAFLFLAAALFDPQVIDERTLVPGCNRRILAEQVRIAFFVGTFTTALQNYGNSSLGYDLNGFEQRFSQLSNGARFPDHNNRHPCHDAAAAALLTLHQANEMLKATSNSSIADFSKSPDLVMRAVNSTAPKMRITGMMGQYDYSSRLEFDYLPLHIGQVDPKDRSLRTLAKLTYSGKDEANLFNMSYYSVEKLASSDWWTRNRQPVRDLSSIVHIDIRKPLEFAVASSAIGSISSFAQIVGTTARLVVSFKSRRNELFSRTLDWGVFLLGCLFLNFAAIAYSLDPSVAVCSLRPALVINGLSGILVSLSSELYANKKPLLKYCGRQCASSCGKSDNSRKSSSAKVLDRAWQNTFFEFKLTPETGRRSMIGLVCFIGLSLIWLTTYPYTTLLVSSPIQFDEMKDFYFDETWISCKPGGFEEYWLGAFGACLSAVLFLALTFTGQTWKAASKLETSRSEMRVVQLCVLNIATLVAGGAVLSLAVSDPDPVFAGFLLTGSASSAIIRFGFKKSSLTAEQPYQRHRASTIASNQIGFSLKK